jgi:hypothetical protein
MWTQGFSHFITPLIKEQQASQPHTMHNGEMCTFSAALASALLVLSLTHQWQPPPAQPVVLLNYGRPPYLSTFHKTRAPLSSNRAKCC